MDKIAEAIVKLVDAGAPLANQAIMLYYVSNVLNQALVTITALGVVGLVVHVIKWAMRFDRETHNN